MFPTPQSRNNLKSYWSELSKRMFVKCIHSAHTQPLKNWCCSCYLLRGQDQMMEIHLMPLKPSSSVHTLKETHWPLAWEKHSKGSYSLDFLWGIQVLKSCFFWVWKMSQNLLGLRFIYSTCFKSEWILLGWPSTVSWVWADPMWSSQTKRTKWLRSGEIGKVGPSPTTEPVGSVVLDTISLLVMRKYKVRGS